MTKLQLAAIASRECRASLANGAILCRCDNWVDPSSYWREHIAMSLPAITCGPVGFMTPAPGLADADGARRAGARHSYQG